MIIAVDTRIISKDSVRPERSFLSDVILYLAQTHTEHQFVFLSDRPYADLLPANARTVTRGPKVTHLFLAKYWYDLRLPSLLKKYKADVFLGLNGISSATKIPQCIVVHDISFLTVGRRKNKTHSFFMRRTLQRSLEKAAQVITFSAFMRESITSFRKSAVDNTTITYGSAPQDINPLNEEKKWATRDKFTSGKNYFLYAGTLDRYGAIVQLLKAFSVFKKRQKSDWKLVLAGWQDNKRISIAAPLRTYKHRNDVMLVNADKSTLSDLESAAYALVYPVERSDTGLQVLSAFRHEIPVIVSAGGAAEEIAGDAAIYIDAEDYTDIAEQMMRIYKDEALRNRLIEDGRAIANDYTLEKSAQVFWQSILSAIH